MKLLIIPLLAVLVFGTAHADLSLGTNSVWSWTTANIYQIHAVHVGDHVFVTNTDTKIHSIRGEDTAGEIFQSGAIYPGQQYEMIFMFSGNFTFYDEYNTGNFGVIEIYNPDVTLPTISNTTTTKQSYVGTPYYSNLAVNVTAFEGDGGVGGGGISTGSYSNSTQISFNDSNSTQLVFSGTNATVPNPNTGNETVQNNTIAYWQQESSYWEGQSNSWESKYNTLVSTLKGLLGL